MHKTTAGERRKTLKSEALELARDARTLQKTSHIPAVHHEAQRLQEKADTALAEAEDLTLLGRTTEADAAFTKAKALEYEGFPVFMSMYNS